MRKIKRTVLWFVCALFGLTSCSERQEYRGMLSRAEAVMDDHPDSALTILDSLSTHETEFGKRFLRQYQLRRLQAQNKTFVPLTSDSLAKILVSYYDSHGNANERMLAHYLLGCTYRDMGEAPHAIDCYLDATTQADTTAKDCDFNTLSCVYSQMAEIYYKQLLLSSHIDASRKASYYSFKANKPYYGILNLDKTAASYILLNKIDSAESVLKEVQMLFQQYNLSEKSLQSSTKLMHIYVENPDKLSDAKELIDNYDTKATFFDENHELPSSKRHFYYYKGRYYEGVNKLDSAEYYYRKVYRPNMSFVDKDPMYRGLLSVFTKRHQADSIAKYAKLYCEVNDSSIAKKDQDLTAQMAASYNYNRYQKEAFENERAIDRFRFTLILFAIIVIIASLVFWRRYKTKIRFLKAEYANATNEYNNNIHILELIKHSHQGTINAIAEELEQEKKDNSNYRAKYYDAQKVIERINAQYDNNRNELEQENASLKQEIEVLQKSEVIYKNLKKSKQFIETDAVKRILELMNKPLQPISDEEWNQLISISGLYFPSLLRDLRNKPKLSNQHIRACILIMLNVRGTDIANRLNIKDQRVTNIKSEINRELFGDNSARSLYKNIMEHYNIYPL